MFINTNPSNSNEFNIYENIANGINRIRFIESKKSKINRRMLLFQTQNFQNHCNQPQPNKIYSSKLHLEIKNLPKSIEQKRTKMIADKKTIFQHQKKSQQLYHNQLQSKKKEKMLNNLYKRYKVMKGRQEGRKGEKESEKRNRICNSCLSQERGEKGEKEEENYLERLEKEIMGKEILKKLIQTNGILGKHNLSQNLQLFQNQCS